MTTTLKSAFEVEDQVCPKAGNFKNKPGTVLEKVWSDRWQEWSYFLKFVRARHWFWESELKGTSS